MPPEIISEPDVDALKAILDKVILATDRNTAGLAEVPLAIRDRAFFSSMVSRARSVQTLRELIAEQLQTTKINPQEFIRQATAKLGLDQADSGRLTDLSSVRRLELIYKHNTAEAHGYGEWEAGHDEDLLYEYPCQELVRVESRKEPREWGGRWNMAGGRIYGGRMIARKDDPVWMKISRFGKPWPPFDFGSGMGVRDINRDEAVALGVIKPGQKVQPPRVGYNEELSKSLDGLDPEMRASVEAALASNKTLRL